MTLAPMLKGFGSIVSPFGGVCRYEYSERDQLRKIWTVSSALPYVAIYSPENSLLESVVLPSGWTYSMQRSKRRKESDGFPGRLGKFRPFSMNACDNFRHFQTPYFYLSRFQANINDIIPQQRGDCIKLFGWCSRSNF